MPFCYLFSVLQFFRASFPLLSSFITIFIVICFEYSLFCLCFFFMIEDLHKISCSYRLLFYVDKKLSFNHFKKSTTRLSCHPGFASFVIVFTQYFLQCVFTDSFFCSSVVEALYYNFHVIHCILQLQHFSFWVFVMIFISFFNFFYDFYFFLNLSSCAYVVFLILLSCLSVLL